MRLGILSIICLIFITGCERQLPLGIPPRDATPSELSPFDGRWELTQSNAGGQNLPFDMVTVSGNGSRVTVNHPDAAVRAVSGEYLDSGPNQFVELSFSVALDADEYELVIRRPEEPNARMSGWLSGDGITGRQMVRVTPADGASE
jgi:hypothetical protein